MNGLVADHGKLVRSWRYKNENGIALFRPIHAQFLKPGSGRLKRITIELAPLNIDTDLG